MKIRAPAKINLTLRVVGKRTDGYHLLDTIMLPVSLFDEIDIRKARLQVIGKRNCGPRVEVTCDHPMVPGDETNLAHRAASLLLKRARSRQPIEIHIRKRIPLGAGLGGGSTDAAATLVGLNRLLKLRLTTQQLERIGLSIGADVPFFIRGRPARARGIGERLNRLRGVPRFWLVLLYPGFPVSTAWVYRNLRVKLTKPSVNTSIASSLKSIPKRGGLLVNDLETVTIKKYPQIGLLKIRLANAGAGSVLMSGSGSSVFGIFSSKRRAQEAFRRLRQEEGAQTFLVRVLS
ncbi:MAG TPA: 4-(cytidine 5'-diphospho)-2-C-methyl-D-erythritol kinase [Candidatus Limnocylindria bacterium]|nr:4-(cytidine 5'-diphospho)-2-C-methyl-D-erythritol kinase [Candidatus Limnocylindria bacterium]